MSKKAKSEKILKRFIKSSMHKGLKKTFQFHEEERNTLHVQQMCQKLKSREEKKSLFICSTLIQF